MAFGLDDFLGNVASSAIGNIFASDSREDTQSFNAEQAALSRAFTKEQMQNKYQWQVKDLQAAGLNPMLAYGQSPGMGNSAAASSGNQATQHVEPYTTARMTASQIAVNDASEKRINAEAEKIAAEKREIEARTPTYAVSMDQMRQNIEQSKATIENLMQQTRTGAASAAMLAAQEQQLKALVPKIQAEVDQLRTLAALNIQHITQSEAQTKALGAQATRDYASAGQLRALEGLTHEQKAEVVQRVRANLPALEAALKDLDRSAKRLEMPGREGEANIQESYIGALGRTLRALNPFSDFMKAAPTATYRGQ